MFLTGFRRLIKVLVLGFAAMGYVAVPIFDKTGLEHTIAFIERPDVQAAEVKAQENLRALEEDLAAKLEERGQPSQETANSRVAPVRHRKKQRQEARGPDDASSPVLGR